MILRSKDHDAIRKHITTLGAEARKIVYNNTTIAYYMRGGISYNSCFDLTPGERDVILDFIKRRLDSQKDSAFPVY